MSPNKGKVHFSKKLKLGLRPTKFNPSASLPLRVQDLLDLEICAADLREEIIRDTGIQNYKPPKYNNSQVANDNGFYWHVHYSPTRYPSA